MPRVVRQWYSAKGGSAASATAGGCEVATMPLVLKIDERLDVNGEADVIMSDSFLFY